MIPRVEGKHYDFQVVGLYNGLALVADLQTGSHWDHVTGECIEGRHRGYELEEGPALEHDIASQVLHRYPDARLALSRPTLRSKLLQRTALKRMLDEAGHLPPSMFEPSLAKLELDKRRPRLELGLGVIEKGGISCFYPLAILRAAQGALIDPKRGLLAYIDPVSGVPLAVRSSASSCHIEDEDVVLDSGARIRARQLVEADGSVHPLDQPAQQFTRWYGFSITFPGCEVFEQDPPSRS